MRKFNEFVDDRTAMWEDFSQFLYENHPQLYRELDWDQMRGWGAKVGRGIIGGAAKLAQKGLGGAAQAGGSALAAGGNALQGNFRQAGQNVVQAARGVGQLASSPFQAAAQGMKSFKDRDMNAAQEIIASITDPSLKQALQQAFQQWQAQQGSGSADIARRTQNPQQQQQQQQQSA